MKQLYPKILGYLIRRARKCREITLKGLAKKLRISKEHLKDYETGLRVPTDRIVGRIAEALGATVPMVLFASSISEMYRRLEKDIHFQRAVLLDYGTYFKEDLWLGEWERDETDKLCWEIGELYFLRRPWICPPYVAKELLRNWIGLQIRIFRKAHNISGKELAQRLGIPVYQLYAAERGERPLSAQRLQELSEALGVPLKEIIGEESRDALFVRLRRQSDKYRALYAAKRPLYF